MRLIGHLPSQQDALRFATFLKSQNIECIIEKETDYQIWIINEDHLDEAAGHLAHFQTNPDDPKYLALPTQEAPFPDAERKTALDAAKARQLRPASLFRRSPAGKLILTVMLICIGIYVWGLYEDSELKPHMADRELQLPLLPPIYTLFLYDYPKALADIEKLARSYTPDQLKNSGQLSSSEQKQIKTTLEAPYYRGLYTKIVRWAKGEPPLPHGPLFQKIGQGQIWRLITPIFLHGGLLHILFNLIWLWVLGNQVEQKIGIWRLALLVLIGGVISNTAQYFMSGPLFFGMSGVVLTLFAFIWVRQRKAPWEGYLLNKITITFITIWIVGIAALQVVLFFLQISGNSLPPIGIANTAHIAGALVGGGCGCLNLFSAK